MNKNDKKMRTVITHKHKEKNKWVAQITNSDVDLLEFDSEEEAMNWGIREEREGRFYHKHKGRDGKFKKPYETHKAALRPNVFMKVSRFIRRIFR